MAQVDVNVHRPARNGLWDSYGIIRQQRVAVDLDARRVLCHRRLASLMPHDPLHGRVFLSS